MLFVPSFVRVTAVLAAKRAGRQCWPRSGHDRTTAHARLRTTTHDHEWPTTHERARPCTTTHDHAWPTTRARPTTAAIFVWGSGTHPTPGGLRCLLPPAYPQNVKKVTNVFLVCVFCTSAHVLYDQNTVIIYVNLMPNYFSQYCMLGCF